MGMTIDKPYRFIILSEDIEEVKKMREYNNQVIPDKSTAIAVDTNEQFIFQDGKWRKKTIKKTIKMTIDEAIKYLRALKRCETCEEADTGHYKSCSCYRIGSLAKCYDAIEVGIDTMKKYQKIEQIIKNAKDSDGAVKYNWLYEQIREVLEDGKID